MNPATNAICAPTIRGGPTFHSIALMFRYQVVALSGLTAYAATSTRGRAISISVTTSTLTPWIVAARRPAPLRDAGPAMRIRAYEDGIPEAGGVASLPLYGEIAPVDVGSVVSGPPESMILPFTIFPISTPE